MGAKPQTTTTVNKPWEPTEGYWKDLYAKASTAFDNTNNKPFTGEIYAGPTQAQQDAIAGVKAAAPGMGIGVPELRDLAMSMVRGDWLNPASNPYIKSVADAAISPVQDAFNKNKLAVSDRAIAEGAYGGARQDLQQNKLVNDAAKTMGDITSGIYYNNYNNERQLQMAAPGLLDKANLLSLAGPTALSGAGAVEQGFNQAALDAELKKFQMNQGANWSGMSELASILGAGGFGNSTTTAEKASNPLLGMIQGLMGGGITGAGLATNIGGVAAGAGLGAFAPWMIPFAALGGLAGAL